MPWTFDAGNTKSITEKLKKVGSKEPAFESELIQQLKVLLADFPELLQWLDKQNTQSPNPLRANLFTTQLHAYTNNSSKFYWQLINKEALRVLNAYTSRSKKWSNKVDVIYHTNLLLKSIKALAQQTVKEIEARGLQELPNEQSNLVHFVLHLLKQQLIVLYFDIQELSKHSLDTISSLEDFYLTELSLPLTRMQPLHFALKMEIPADKIPVHLLQQFKQENQEIERIEVALRELVLNVYSIRTLKDFRRVVPSNIQDKVNEALEREEKKNPALVNPKRELPEYLIQFTDLQ